MSFRSVLSFSVWLTVVLVACLIISGEGVKYDPKNGSHYLKMSTKNYLSDKLYFTHRIICSSKFLRVVSKDVIYPPPNSNLQITVTAFEVIDNYLDGYGGYAFHTSGGIGCPHVGFHLKSQRNHGFEFMIKIHGKRNSSNIV